MHQEDATPKHEVRRAKRLAATFDVLQKEIAALEPFPSMDPCAELDAAARALADEWLDAHTDRRAATPRATNAPQSSHRVRG